jgi:selenocysteine lyase/cysteine desulfurase
METVNINDILYESPIISTPLRKSVKIVFADDTASGRPCKLIDSKMINEIHPYYSNTHSNAFTGIMMKNLIKDTKLRIRKTYDLDKSHKIIFTGSGTTGAINHLVGSIDFNKYKETHIFISTYEHYSNHLPWVEKSKDEEHIKIRLIPIKNDDIDFDWLNDNIQKDCEILNIVSITACSNVTGIITDLPKLKTIIKSHNDVEKSHIYLFIDCACLAPYEIMNLHDVDACFISMHKFLGGQTAPGILIARQNLFTKSHPYNPGGGCVKKASAYDIQYEDDLEKKESGGTPNILGIIRTKFVYELREKYMHTIVTNEKYITQYIHEKFEKICTKNTNVRVIMLSKLTERRLPIISLSIKDLHYNFVVALLNDLFGIQTRGGISCNGIFGDHIKKKYDMDGWCRITFSWLMSKQTIDYILSALTYVAKFGKHYKSLYTFNTETNLFIYTGKYTYDIPEQFLIK